jgi:hypothetical protein
MSCLRTQPLRSKPSCFGRFLAFAAAMLIFFGLNAAARAQAPTAPASILGQVIGDDVSVIGASHVVSGVSGRAIEFSSGDTIVAFSGKARVEFTNGGELDICGPAKFTVLSSGEALTVALNFGRVRVRFDAVRPIAIYMPLVIATPIPIENNPRDATVGLTNTGTMCVLATSGAIRLQNQLSGESTIVPQPSEVFVPGSSFVSLPPAMGQCDCDYDEPSAQQSTPSASAPITSGSAAPVPTAPPQETPPVVAQTPTITASAPKPTPPLVAGSQPTVKTLPPIAYDAKSATETPEPISVATLMLAQQTVVQPAWIFHGTVIDPRAKNNSQLSEASAAQNSTAPPKPKKRGFWAKLHHFLTGSS